MDIPPDFKAVRPEKAIAFDPVEFQFAFAYATGVSHAPATTLNRPTDVKIMLKNGRKKWRYTFADNPMNRLGLAMAQRFRNDQQKYFSFMWRWFAFIELVYSGVLGDEFRKEAKSQDEPDMIHPYVVELAGSFPLTAKGRFEHGAFLAELRRRILKDEPAA